MDIYSTFINDFSQMEGDISSSIVEWFVKRGVNEAHIGNELAQMAHNLFHLERYVEAYWVLHVCKIGYSEDEKNIGTIQNLMEIAKNCCIEKAQSWTETDFVCQPEDKPLLKKQLSINMGDLLSFNPQLAALALNSTSNRMLEIQPIQNGNALEKHFHIIDNERIPAHMFNADPLTSIENVDTLGGVCFYGMGGGIEIISVHNLTHKPYPLYKIGLYILEPSLSIFKANLAVNDWKDFFGNDRVFWYIGEEGCDAFFDYFENEIQFIPTFGASIDPAVTQAMSLKVDRIIEKKEQEYIDLMEQVESFYGNRSKEEWQSVFNGKRPLRVMGLTTRFTVYIKHSMRDLLEGFKEIGCEIELLIEKDDTLRTTNHYSIDMINSFKPDLVLGICYNRSNLSFKVPDSVPFINWQQDKLPHCEDPETIKKLGKTDFFIITFFYTLSWMIEKGYPKEKLHHFEYYPTNPKIYSPIPLSTGEQKKYTCDVSFVSNCSAPAKQAFNELYSDYNHLEDSQLNILSLFYDRIEETFNSWIDYPTNTDEYEWLFKEFCDQKNASLFSKDLIKEISYKFHFIGDRFLRHRPLEKLANDGVELALYGNGWESHPTLGRYAKGVAKNGEELNLINNASKIVYHALSTSTLHSRFIDAAASGSFILVKHLNSDFDPVDRLFKDKEEFVYFDGPSDISEKVFYYLNHPDERKMIGENARKKAQHYSYGQTAKKLIEIIAKNPENIKME